MKDKNKAKDVFIAARVDADTKNKIEEVRRKLGERSLNAVMVMSVDKMIKEVLGSNNSSVASA